MGKGKELTPRKRSIIIQYWKDGFKQRDICKNLSLSKSVVCTIVKRFRERGSSSPGKRSGRPRATSKREDSAIKRSAMKYPFYSSLQLK